MRRGKTKDLVPIVWEGRWRGVWPGCRWDKGAACGGVLRTEVRAPGTLGRAVAVRFCLIVGFWAQ